MTSFYLQQAYQTSTKCALGFDFIGEKRKSNLVAAANAILSLGRVTLGVSDRIKLEAPGACKAVSERERELNDGKGIILEFSIYSVFVTMVRSGLLYAK